MFSLEGGFLKIKQTFLNLKNKTNKIIHNNLEKKSDYLTVDSYLEETGSKDKSYDHLKNSKALLIPLS